jgi:diketogulonate reductase-like aldo/keto reductase
MGHHRLRYVCTDLMLLHWPCKTGVEDTRAAWLGLQQALQRKLVRAIGVRYLTCHSRLPTTRASHHCTVAKSQPP